MAYGTYTNGNNTTLTTRGKYFSGTSYTEGGLPAAATTSVRLTANLRRPIRPYSVVCRTSVSPADATAGVYINIDYAGDNTFSSSYQGFAIPTTNTTPVDTTFILTHSYGETFFDASYFVLPLSLSFNQSYEGVTNTGYFATTSASPAGDSSTFVDPTSTISNTFTDGLYYVLNYIQSPSAPTITAITSPTVSGQLPRVTVTWTAPTDNGGLAIAGYDIYLANGTYLDTVSGTTLTKTFYFDGDNAGGYTNGADGGPLFNGQYGSKLGFKVRAYNQMNVDASAFYGDATTDGTDSAVVYATVSSFPSSPQSIVALQTPVSSGAFTLYNVAPKYNGGNAITGYTHSIQKFDGDPNGAGVAVGSPTTVNTAATTSTVRTNLVTNPAFGYGLTGWSSYHVNHSMFRDSSYEATQAWAENQGMGALAVYDNGQGTSAGAVFGPITTTASTTYTALAYVHLPVTPASTPVEISISITELTSASAVVGTTTGIPFKINPNSTAASYWHPIVVSRTFGTTGVKANVTIRTNRGIADLNPLFIDSVLFETTSSFMTYGGTYFDGNCSSDTQSDNISPGEIRTWPTGTTLPAGFAWCDGAYLNKYTYSDLYSTIHDGYGADVGDTFKLPNLNAGPVKYIIAVAYLQAEEAPYRDVKLTPTWSGNPNASTSLAISANPAAQLTGLDPLSYYKITTIAKTAFTTTSTLASVNSKELYGYTAGVPDAVTTLQVLGGESGVPNGTLRLKWNPSDAQYALTNNTYTPGAPVLYYRITDQFDNILTYVYVTAGARVFYFQQDMSGFNGDSYAYRVYAENAIGTSAGSDTVSNVVPGPSAAPTVLYAEQDAKSAGRVKVIWETPPVGTDTLTGYIIKQTDTSGVVLKTYKVKNITSLTVDSIPLGVASLFTVYTTNFYTDNRTNPYEFAVSPYGFSTGISPYSTSTVPLAAPVQMNNLTNAAFSGTQVITDKDATNIYFTSPISGTIAEANIVSGFGTVSNLTNISLTEDSPYVISTTGPDATSFSYTISDTLSVAPGTSVSGGLVHNVTDEAFNGERTISGEPNVGSSTVRLTFATTDTAFSARAAGGTVENLSITDFNGIVTVTGVTETTVTYTAPGTPADVAETESSGQITDLTNNSHFNGQVTVSGIPTHNTFTYTKSTGGSTAIDKDILSPYGTATKAESSAEVEVKFRSGWIG